MRQRFRKIFIPAILRCRSMRKIISKQPNLPQDRFSLEFTPLCPANEFDTILGDEGRKAGVTETRRKFFALSGGHPAALAFIGMDQNTTLTSYDPRHCRRPTIPPPPLCRQNMRPTTNLPICKRFVKPHIAASHESFDGYSTTLSPPMMPDPRQIPTPHPQ